MNGWEEVAAENRQKECYGRLKSHFVDRGIKKALRNKNKAAGVGCQVVKAWLPPSRPARPFLQEIADYVFRSPLLVNAFVCFTLLYCLPT